MYCMCIHRGAFNCILFFCMDVLSKEYTLRGVARISEGGFPLRAPRVA